MSDGLSNLIGDENDVYHADNIPQEEEEKSKSEQKANRVSEIPVLYMYIV